MHKLPFAVLAITLVFALTTCKNPWINELLKSPSELSSLEVVAFAGETRLQGGAAFEPPFSAAVRDYLVYVPLETSRFTVNAGYDGNGNITWTTQGMDGAVSSNSFTFRFHDIEDTLELTMAVERENMDIGIYRLAVIRTDNIPPPKITSVSVTPSVATYFLGGGIVPVVEVVVEPPTDGGTLSYQWFRNEVDNNVTGTLLAGQTGTSYTLSDFELEEATTMYYYVEVTKTLEGKTSRLASNIRSVTFLDRAEVLEIKSGQRDEVEHYWVRVPGGIVNPIGDDGYGGSDYWVSDDDCGGYMLPWYTNGFLMARYPVTYELWELVRTAAEKENYKFANEGNQGAVWVTDDPTYPYRTLNDPRPVGNKLHPVTMVGWRDVIAWCNAYSEMCGLDPVYLDSNGNVLRDSRQPLEWLIDDSRMAGKNGYRLPLLAEQEYAARGANPNDATTWRVDYIGEFEGGNRDDYMWNPPWDDSKTDEVGGRGSTQRLPNSIGLYDIVGNVLEWCYLNHDLFLYDPGLAAKYGGSTVSRAVAMLEGAFDGGSNGGPAPDLRINEHENPRYRWFTDITENKGFRLIRYE